MVGLGFSLVGVRLEAYIEFGTRRLSWINKNNSFIPSHLPYNTMIDGCENNGVIWENHDCYPSVFYLRVAIGAYRVHTPPARSTGISSAGVKERFVRDLVFFFCSFCPATKTQRGILFSTLTHQTI